MRKAVVFLCIIVAFQAMAADTRAAEQVRFAVLPFEVFSIADDHEFGEKIAETLARRLAVDPSLVAADSTRVQAVLQEDEYAGLSLERLTKIARALGVQYVVLGSATIIREDISIDVQLFSRRKRSVVFKTFAEGTDRADLAERIAVSIEEEISLAPGAGPAPTAPSASGRAPVADSLEAVLKEPFPPVQERGPDEERTEQKPAVLQEEDIEEQELPVSREDVETEQERAAPGEEDLTDREPSEPVVSDAETAPPETDLEEAPEEDTGPDDGGAPAGQQLFASDKPININADSMEYDNKNNIALFSGNVVARQADIVMFADRMKVLYSSTGGVQRVSATGNVRIVQGDRIATGAQMVFYADEQKIVATGNPRVWQGDNVIHGEKITVYIKEDRSVVEGGPGDRASATIYPNQ